MIYEEVFNYSKVVEWVKRDVTNRSKIYKSLILKFNILIKTYQNLSLYRLLTKTI